jgi:hypothetical protein
LESTAFRDRYPEFKNVGTDLLAATLAEAALQIDSTVYGTKADLAHGLLTAHMLAISPFGRSERTEPGSQETLYWKQYQAVFRQVAPRMIVT